MTTTVIYENDSPEQQRWEAKHWWVSLVAFVGFVGFVFAVAYYCHRRDVNQMNAELDHFSRRRFRRRQFGRSDDTPAQLPQRQSQLSVWQKIAQWFRGVGNAIVCKQPNGVSQTPQALVHQPTVLRATTTPAPRFDEPVLGVPLHREGPMQVQLHIIAPEGLVIAGAPANDVVVEALPNRDASRQLDLPARQDIVQSTTRSSDDAFRGAPHSTHEEQRVNADLDERRSEDAYRAPVSRASVSRGYEAEVARRSRVSTPPRTTAQRSQANRVPVARRNPSHHTHGHSFTSHGARGASDSSDQASFNTWDSSFNTWDSSCGGGCSGGSMS